MVGVPFRPQGHDPATGLDCVGLVSAAYAAAGRPMVPPVGYPMRGWARERIEAGLAMAGFAPVSGEMCTGDVALITYDAGQFHLGLIGPGCLVHAHAGLKRVVETPFDGLIRDAAGWRIERAPRRCGPASLR